MMMTITGSKYNYNTKNRPRKVLFEAKKYNTSKNDVYALVKQTEGAYFTYFEYNTFTITGLKTEKLELLILEFNPFTMTG